MGDEDIGYPSTKLEFSFDCIEDDMQLLVKDTTLRLKYENSVFIELSRDINFEHTKENKRLVECFEKIFNLMLQVDALEELEIGNDFCLMFTQVGVNWTVDILGWGVCGIIDLGFIEESDPTCFYNFANYLKFLQQKEANIKRVFLFSDPKLDEHFNLVFV